MGAEDGTGVGEEVLKDLGILLALGVLLVPFFFKNLTSRLLVVEGFLAVVVVVNEKGSDNLCVSIIKISDVCLTRIFTTHSFLVITKEQ